MNCHTLDVRNLLCPLPVIRLQNTVADLPVGCEITVLCTDPGVLYDIPAWCRMYGHQLLSSTQQDHVFTLVVKTHCPSEPT